MAGPAARSLSFSMRAQQGRLPCVLRGSLCLQAPNATGSAYAVRATVHLPPAFTTPLGGIRLRLRAPLEHAGKLSKVTVGGVAWADFDAAEETVNIAAGTITPALAETGLVDIVATFGAAAATPLRAANDASRR